MSTDQQGSADEDCLFCKIVSGDIDADVVHESPTTVAFRDLNPQAPTHVLVIPRSHYPNAAALAAGEPETAVDLFDRRRRDRRERGPGRGIPARLQHRRPAHQTVFHAHLHVLGGRAMTWPPG